MGIQQFQRGMRHRIKTIQLRLRRQARHLARHRKARKAAAPPCDAPLAACIESESPQMQSGPSGASANADVSVPFPTLRRSGNRKPDL
jgi:hypothetical protein